ncbi:MAG TPA: replicative DNA helicase, partial [Gammaproteobacteria bacterium]|nr:replicative DNA helicase [Gammaproteobacteria bacterium]
MVTIAPTKDKQLQGLRMPPQAIEAEQSVLGGLMLSNDAWDKIADRIYAEDFYLAEHRQIFSAIANLSERNKPFDVVTLSNELEAQGLLIQVGGLAYLSELVKETPTAANIIAYAD